MEHTTGDDTIVAWRIKSELCLDNLQEKRAFIGSENGEFTLPRSLHHQRAAFFFVKLSMKFGANA